MMKSLGTHLLVELWSCDKEKLDSIKFIEKSMVDAANYSGATVLNSVFQNFNPQGISGVVIIAESHLTVHTWPEYGYAAIDIFTCGDKVDPWKASEFLESAFEASKVQISSILRGLRH